MATITLDSRAAPAHAGSRFPPLRAIRGFFLLFSGATVAAAEVESLSRLSDAALAERGLTREGIVQHAMRHLPA